MQMVILIISWLIVLLKVTFCMLNPIIIIIVLEFKNEELSQGIEGYLGSGGFGKVYKGLLRGTAVAIKYLNEVCHRYFHL